jgi:hypothetical protein
VRPDSCREAEISSRDRELLSDLCDGCCDPDSPCPLKARFAEVRVPGRRTLVQLKCAELLFRDRRGVPAPCVGEAMSEFIHSGGAAAFARFYEPRTRIPALYSLIRQEVIGYEPAALAGLPPNRPRHGQGAVR